MQYVVIHTATRVVRRVSTDPSGGWPRSDETSVQVPDDWNPTRPASTYVKLAPDNVSLLVPTQNEIDLADVDPARIAYYEETLKSQLDAAITTCQATPTTANLKAFFDVFLRWLNHQIH